MPTRPSSHSPALRRVLTRRSRLPRDLLIALGGVGVCTGIRALLTPFLGFGHTFITFFPAVILAGAVAGARAGLIALAAAGLIVWWVFMPPPFSFEVRDPRDVAALIDFIAAAGFSGAFAAYLRAILIRLWEGEERQRLLAQELNHRVKNALSTALALATLTLPKTGEMKQALAVYANRLNAIARANALLTHEGWEAADLAAVLALELAPLGDRAAARGPPVKLPAKAATNLSMVVHELATNSMKYGALSGHGRVDVAWRAHDGACGPRATLNWTETGGPPVAAPSERGSGFGSKLIGRLAKELGGSVELDFRPEGLRAEIDFPVAVAERA